MSDLRELYQEVILDHQKKPRNCHKIEDASCHLQGYNPLCGDKCTVYVKLDDHDTITDISFEGAGCAISTASASMMTQSLKGKSRAEAEVIFKQFQDLVTGKTAPEEAEALGKLVVFAGVREFPARVKCATLAWHTFHAALEGKDEPVSTE